MNKRIANKILLFIAVVLIVYLVLSFTVTKCRCIHDSDMERYIHYVVLDAGIKALVSLSAGGIAAFLFSRFSKSKG